MSAAGLRETALRTDWVLLASATVIALLGIAFIDSARASGDELAKETLRQGAYLVLAFGAFALTAWADYRRLVPWAWALWGLSLLPLLLVLEFGLSAGGAQSWLRVGPVSVQPSEFAKVTTLLLVAAVVGRGQAGRLRFSDALLLGLAVGLPALLVLAQNDTGTAASFVPLLLGAVFVSGLRMRWVVAAALLGALLAPVGWSQLKPYQKKRIMVVFDPTIDPRGVGWQPIQSLNAVGGGGLLGQGYKQGAQNRLGYLPERHTDYIFAIVAEEGGFVGATFVLCLYGLLLSRLGRATALARDRTGAMICLGVFLFLAAHVFVNVGMVVGLLPTVGIPLLLLSSGGSALIATFIMLGLATSVGLRRQVR